MTILAEPWRITLEQKVAELDDHNAVLRNALRHIIDRHDTPEGDAVTVQIARKALGS
jgi:hypothetical protein